MSSARMLLAAVAFGLAACTYTPARENLYPSLSAGAPVLMVDAEIPAGYNDHVVIIVDHDGIARALAENGTTTRQAHRYAAYPYARRPVTHTANTQPATTSGSTAIPQTQSRPGRRVTVNESPRRTGSRPTR